MIKKSSLKKIAEYLNDTKALSGAKDRLALYIRMRDNCMTTKKQSYKVIIDNQIGIVENLQLQVNRDKHDLSRLVNQEGDQFYVFYLHYVKRRTLKEVAELMHYSRVGVCKILQRIKRKCILING